MTATLSIQHDGRRFLARVTVDGKIIGQAVNVDQQACQRSAIRQAWRWGADRGWGPLTIVKRKESA